MLIFWLEIFRIESGKCLLDVWILGYCLIKVVYGDYGWCLECCNVLLVVKLVCIVK